MRDLWVWLGTLWSLGTVAGAVVVLLGRPFWGAMSQGAAGSIGIGIGVGCVLGATLITARWIDHYS